MAAPVWGKTGVVGVRVLRSRVAQEFLWGHRFGKLGRLLLHREFGMEQMDILAHMSDPFGLGGLQICLLLERLGYSRRVPTSDTEERLLQIEKEMEESGDKSVDGGCSICTGTAASCLALAGREGKAASLVECLKTLKEHRFAHLQRDC